MLDVDFFKRINDCWGHAAGDLVLKTLGDLLREHTPPGAIASRYGGEEFCIVLPGLCEESARQWAEQFRETIAATEIQFEQVTLRMTASLGVAEKLGDVQHPAQLINLADRSLLLAKRSGRNRVVCNSSQSSLNRKTEDSTKKSHFDLNSANARQVMIPVIGGLKSDATSQDAAEYFLRLRISFAPVVDENLAVVGLLSERDLLSTMLSNEWSKLYVKDVMSPNVVCFEEDTRLAEIMDFICRASCSAVVITRHGSVVGMVTLSSLLRWINNLADTQRDTIPAANFPEISHRKENVFHQAAKISSALSHEAERLEAYLHQRDENWLPALIAGASRLQELVSDLLACAHQPTNASSSCNQTQQGLAGLLALTGGLTATIEDTAIDMPAPEHSI